MAVSLFRKFLRARRAATAVAMAIMFVPLLIGASAAVDFARIASARALMQAAVDGAAESGANGYQMSENHTDSTNVTTTTLTGTSAQLGNFVTVNTTGIGVYCSALGTNTQCGSTTQGQYATGTYSGYCPASWGGTKEYCVVATLNATLKNSLFAYLVPSEVLSVKSVALTSFPPSTINGNNIPPSPGFGSAGDISDIAAYAVPIIGGSASYATLPSAAGCSGVPGVDNLPNANNANPNGCQYLFIAASNSAGNGGNGGSISLQSGQPIAFTFINDTGANGYTQLDGTNLTNNIMVYPAAAQVGGTYYQNGKIVSYDSVTTTATTCKSYSGSNCTSTSTSTATTTNNNTNATGTTSSCTQYYPANQYSGQCKVTTQVATTLISTALYGECPSHTLYGSLSSGYGAPLSDNLNVYSSAYEMLGDPPTQYTNHVLTPFVTNYVNTQTINGTNYYTAAVCPNYPRSGTSISAAVKGSYSNSSGITTTNNAGVNAFATWFPNGQQAGFSDSAGAPATDTSGTAITSGTSDVFPPAVAGCTPATNAADGGVTNTSVDPWWGWTGSNLGNCTGNTAQASKYNNCALLIQPLGTSVPVNGSNEAILPDYYTTIEDSSSNIIALDPIYDGLTYTDPLTGTSTTNSSAAGYVPSNSTATSTTIGATGLYNSGQFVGDKIVTQTPATSGVGQDHNLPLSTSFQCYDPSKATTLAGYYVGPTGNQVEVPGYNSSGLPLDPVQNPQLGAIICNQNPPETYALYWNDLGTYGSDDLGYWNAVEGFTCSTPAVTNAGGGPSTLAG